MFVDLGNHFQFFCRQRSPPDNQMHSRWPRQSKICNLQSEHDFLYFIFEISHQLSKILDQERAAPNHRHQPNLRHPKFGGAYSLTLTVRNYTSQDGDNISSRDGDHNGTGCIVHTPFIIGTKHLWHVFKLKIFIFRTDQTMSFRNASKQGQLTRTKRKGPNVGSCQTW